MNNVTKTLIEAKAIIAKPENWTQGVFARDKTGHQVHVADPDAVCFCSLGALRKTGIKETSGAVYMRARGCLADSGGSVDIANINDTSTHEEVMAMWDKAIEASKEL